MLGLGLDLRSDDRGRIQFVDIVMGFASLVAFTAVAPWLWEAIGMAQTEVDPFSSVLLSLMLPIFVISMLVSMAVSGRTS